MRTYEQLEKDDFENLTYGEMCEYELDCSYCPLNGDFCTCGGAMKCYGGMPIEPPCCGFNDEDILQDIYIKWARIESKQEAYDREQEEKLKEKQRKSEERKKKLREYKFRNWEDLDKIKELKKKIKREEKRIKSINNLRCIVQAIDSVNKMFKEASQPNNQKDVDEQPIVDVVEEIRCNILDMEYKILEIKEQIKKKEKDFKKNLDMNKGDQDE